MTYSEHELEFTFAKNEIMKRDGRDCANKICNEVPQSMIDKLSQDIMLLQDRQTRSIARSMQSVWAIVADILLVFFISIVFITSAKVEAL